MADAGQVDRHGGRTIIVTGAAAGLGRATSTQLVSEGASVVGIDMTAPELHEVATALGPAFTPVVGSVACAPDVENLIAVARAVTGRVDGLVNNAAVLDGLAPIDECDEETWDHVLDVNLKGPYRLCRHVVPLMVAQGGGSIVNVSSVAGMYGYRGGIAYTSSKHGLIGLTRNIAASHGSVGVRCNAVCPGGMQTEIGTRTARSASGQAVLERVLPANPGSAEPEAVAEVISFLSSDAARNINGAVIVSDGGWTSI
jgi:NAD(P)-dependent dehydrogenase (short-subunit alcohol dehydrogenase family)